MRVITAIENLNFNDDDIVCFLAGGITNCPNWQREVIKELESMPNTDRLVILNPRRDNFPIDDPNASEHQINWEFLGLEMCDIFSMYFCGGESLQPICLYELGRNLCRYHKDVIISVESGYKRKGDVIIQTNLATQGCLKVNTPITPKEHALLIYDSYKKLS